MDCGACRDYLGVLDVQCDSTFDRWRSQVINDYRRSWGSHVARRLVSRFVLGVASVAVLDATAYGAVTITFDDATMPTHAICGRMVPDAYVQLNLAGSTTSVTGQVRIWVRGYPSGENATVAYSGVVSATTATFSRVLLDQVIAVMSPGDTGIEFFMACNDSITAAGVCANVTFSDTYVVENYGMGGPDYDAERAPCMAVEASRGIVDDSGIIAVNASCGCMAGELGSGFETGFRYHEIIGGSYVGVQLEVYHYSCSTSELCIQGEAVCGVELCGTPACTLEATYSVVTDEGCAEFVNAEGGGSCATVCNTGGDIVVDAVAGFNFFVVWTAEDADIEACGGHSVQNLTQQHGCGCPDPLSALSQPEAFIYGPYYRQDEAGLNFNDNVDGYRQGDLEALTDLLDTDAEVQAASDAIDDALTGSRFWDGSGAQPGMGDFLDELVAASVATDYPAPILLTEPVLVQMDFNVLAGYTTAPWRTMFRNFFTGFVLLRLLMSSLINVMWGFGIGTFEDLANYFAPVRGVLVADDVWKRHGYVDLSKREAP